MELLYIKLYLNCLIRQLIHYCQLESILQYGNIDFYLNYVIGSKRSKIKLSSCFVEVEYYYNESYKDYQNARKAVMMGFSCFGDNANCLPLARTFRNYNLYLIEESN